MAHRPRPGGLLGDRPRRLRVLERRHRRRRARRRRALRPARVRARRRRARRLPRAAGAPARRPRGATPGARGGRRGAGRRAAHAGRRARPGRGAGRAGAARDVDRDPRSRPAGCYLLKLAGLSVPRRALEDPRVEARRRPAAGRAARGADRGEHADRRARAACSTSASRGWRRLAWRWCCGRRSWSSWRWRRVDDGRAAAAVAPANVNGGWVGERVEAPRRSYGTLRSPYGWLTCSWTSAARGRVCTSTATRREPPRQPAPTPQCGSLTFARATATARARERGASARPATGSPAAARRGSRTGTRAARPDQRAPRGAPARRSAGTRASRPRRAAAPKGAAPRTGSPRP